MKFLDSFHRFLFYCVYSVRRLVLGRFGYLRLILYFGQKPTTQGGGVAVTRLQFIFTEKTGRGKGADWAENLAPCLDCLTWCLGRRLPRLPSCKSARHNLKKIDTKSWKQPKYLFYYEVLESYIPPGWLPPFSSRNTFILSPFSAAAQQSIAKQQQCWAEALDQSMSCHKMGKERRPRRRIFMAFLLQETSQEKKIKWFSSMLTLFSWWFAQNNVTFALYALKFESIFYIPKLISFLKKITQAH